MKTLLRWLAVLMVLIALLPEGVNAQTPNPPKPSGEIAPVQQPADVTDESAVGELPKGGSPSGPPWTVQRIDNRHFFSQEAAAKHNLKIDSLGNPHIVYGGDHLYHTWWSSGFWHTEVVDQTFNVGSNASLAIDYLNKLHIAYYDADNLEMKYATNRWGYWTNISIAGDAGVGTDIAVDGDQDPYFIYRTIDDQLMFACLQDEVMIDPPELISGDKYVSNMFSMAMRNSLEIHVIFNEVTVSGEGLVGTLYYTTTKTNPRWNPKGVYDGDELTGKQADIAVDTTGYPHIVFGFSDVSLELTASRYFKSINNGDIWTTPFDSFIDVTVPDGLALVLNGSNLPTVAMQVGGKLYKYTWSGSAWVSQLVDPGTGTGFYPAVALYPPTVNSGNPAFAYLDDPAGKTIHLNYREIYGGSWWPADGPALVDLSEKVGACSTSLTGPDGNPWVVYSGEPTKKMYFKRFYNGAWTAAQEIGSEYTGTLNCFHAASAGGGKAAVLFTTEDAHLLYSTITCTGATCVISSSEVIQTTLAYPQNFIDLVLDGNGYPHMVFLRDGTSSKELVYMYDVGLDWVTRYTPIESDFVSNPQRSISIKRTTGGVLHIVYHKSALWNSPYYINYTRGVWSDPLRLSVDNEEINNGVSIFLNSAGDPGVVYTKINSPSQIFLKQRNCGIICAWPASPLVVDTWSESSAFYLPSLVIDSLDRYRLSYVQNANGSRYLQYVQITGTQMAFRNVYLYHGLGSMSSLALSPTGVGRISFNDATNGDLLFAWQNLELFLPMVKR